MENYISDDVLSTHIFIHLSPIKLVDLYSKYPILKSSIEPLLLLYKKSKDIVDIQQYISFCNKNNLFYLKLLTFDNYIQYKDIDNSKILNFDCSFTKLTHLPQLPNIEILNCSNNKLTSIDNLNNIRFLNCENNKLIYLNNISSVRHLICSNNKLPRLPDLPNISYLYCANNSLTSLPSLPKLILIDFSNNKFKTIPSFIDSPHLQTAYY
jgi:hypothetical protein